MIRSSVGAGALERQLAETGEGLARRFAFGVAFVAFHLDSPGHRKKTNVTALVVLAELDELRIGEDPQRGADRAIADAVESRARS